MRRRHAGCCWCGVAVRGGDAACIQCSARERYHRQQMNALAKRKAELEITMMKAELARATRPSEGKHEPRDT